MAIIQFWENNKKYSLKKEGDYILLNNKSFKITQIKNENKNTFISINNIQYKASIIENNSKKIKIYIFNFNKSFTFYLKKTLKEENIHLFNKTDVIDNLTSPLAGRIIKIHVKKNDLIKKNQTLITIESMKMENELRATEDCFIKTIQISQSDLVKPNQVLMTFIKKGEKNGKRKNKYEQEKI